MTESLYAVPGSAVSAPSEGVGFGTRALARIIDTFLHYGVTLVTSVMVGVIIGMASMSSGGVSQATMNDLQSQTPWDFIFALLGYVFYHTVAEGLGATTLGKAITGSVVVNGQGKDINIGQALGRSFAYFIDSLFFGIVAYVAMNKSPLHQRNGDRWADTLVVKRSSADQTTLPGAGMAALGIFGGMAADAVMVILLIIIKLAL